MVNTNAPNPSKAHSLYYTHGPGYLEFGYYEHPVITSRFASQSKKTLSIEINIKDTRIPRLPFLTGVLLLISRCKQKPVLFINKTFYWEQKGVLDPFAKDGFYCIMYLTFVRT